MTVSTLILAALAAQSLPVPGAVRWEPVAEDSGGHYEIDPTSLVRSGTRVRVLIRAIAARAEVDGTSSAVVRYLIDCQARTAAMLTADFYRGDAFASSRAVDEDQVQLRPIEAGTGEVGLHRRVCDAAESR
jgi:hypothetical protein